MAKEHEYIGKSRLKQLLGYLKTVLSKKADVDDIPDETTISSWGFTKNKGTVTDVKIGETSYQNEDGEVNLPSYPTTLPASDVPAWAKEDQKPTYTADEVGALPKTTTHLSGDISTTEKGVANGVATLGSDGKVPNSQLPSYSTLTLGETANTAYRGDRGKTAYEHSQSAHAPSDAQANVIESIKVNGATQTVTNKSVDIPVPDVSNVLRSEVPYHGVKTTYKNFKGTVEAENVEVSYVDEQGEQYGGKSVITPGGYKNFIYNSESELYMGKLRLAQYIDDHTECSDIILDPWGDSRITTDMLEIYTAYYEIHASTVIYDDTIFYRGDLVWFNVVDDDLNVVGANAIGNTYLENIGDGTITGAIKEIDTRLDTLAYGEVGGKNLFNEEYPNINDIVKYKTIYVGNGTYTMSTNTPAVDGSANLFFLANKVSSGASTSSNGVYSGKTITVTSTDGYVTIGYRIVNNVSTYNPYNYHTQIEEGTVATPYEPYIPYSVKTLATNQDNLKMLGYTIPQEMSVQNSIMNGVFTQRVSRVDLGSLNWSYTNANSANVNNYYFKASLPDAVSAPGWADVMNLYCSKYKSVSFNTIRGKNKGASLAYNSICICDTSYTDATAFKNAMKEQNVYLYYELATPITKNVDGNEIIGGKIPLTSTSHTVSGSYVRIGDVVTVTGSFVCQNDSSEEVIINAPGIQRNFGIIFRSNNNGSLHKGWSNGAKVNTWQHDGTMVVGHTYNFSFSYICE